MILTTLEQWYQWSKNYSMLPHVHKYAYKNNRVSSWARLWDAADKPSFVLESGKQGRYTYIALSSISTIHGKEMDAEIKDQDGKIMHRSGSPLSVVKNWMSAYRSPQGQEMGEVPLFIGGCVGYWSYDIIRSIEKIPLWTEDDLPIPDYYFMMVDQLYIIDHEKDELYCAVHVPINNKTAMDELFVLHQSATEQVNEMKRKWDRMILESNDDFEESYKHTDSEVPPSADKMTSFSKADFMEAVEKIQEYIRQGDVFQVNLSVRQSRKLHTSPEEIYDAVRLLNPSPYMGLLRFPDFSLVSASPELLVQKVGGKLRTRPIAGTRPRGKNEQEDQRLSKKLLENIKERAEHVMLVDLERNDLGRISKYGSVQVKDFMVLEYYSHVIHIVSEVVGQLQEGKDAFDVIAATFPGGTITGAPKIRTMEIIEELEPVRRGPYTGSFGWIDYNGNMELNIIIRTLVQIGEIGHIQAGAGIVIDSIPEKEYEESLNKAKALWKAIQYSEQKQSREQFRQEEFQ